MSATLTTSSLIDDILERLPTLRIAVVGDLFLDRYLDIDATLTEPSIETGLDAYQVMGVRNSPGAAGTIINNLAALGVGRILPLSVIGEDGEGFDLRKELAALPAVDATGVFSAPRWRTPTYTKPMLHKPGQPARELNRLDLPNLSQLPEQAENQLLARLAPLLERCDAAIVLDQVTPPYHGIITSAVRDAIASQREGRLILADSRARIGLFRGVHLKPNQSECLRAVPEAGDINEAIHLLAHATGKAVFCTCGERGILVSGEKANVLVPGYPVTGPIDIVGAGDSTSAGIVCALACGATQEQAAAFGNLVASITIQQLGTTGIASPEQVRRRWREVTSSA